MSPNDFVETRVTFMRTFVNCARGFFGPCENFIFAIKQFFKCVPLPPPPSPNVVSGPNVAKVPFYAGTLSGLIDGCLRNEFVSPYISIRKFNNRNAHQICTFAHTLVTCANVAIVGVINFFMCGRVHSSKVACKLYAIRTFASLKCK